MRCSQKPSLFRAHLLSMRHLEGHNPSVYLLLDSLCHFLNQLWMFLYNQRTLVTILSFVVKKKKIITFTHLSF